MKFDSVFSLTRGRFVDVLTSTALAGTMALGMVGCGGSDGRPLTQAEKSEVAVQVVQPGATPFTSFVSLQGHGTSHVAFIRYSIASKPARVSAPVTATYSLAYLLRRGYALPGDSKLTLPVFGLYAGHTNTVAIDIQFNDGSKTSIPLQIATTAYADPNQIYDRPNVIKSRPTNSVLGFNYFYMKSALGTPIVIDTDGEIRWVGIGTTTSATSIFIDNGFVVGSQNSLEIRRLELDGTSTTTALISPVYDDFHHNLDKGKSGLLGEVDATISGQLQIESILAEFTSAGAVIAEWDFGVIIGDHMRSMGDDPTLFVRPGIDWFHMNAATYDARDDSIIASSRENFVIKVDYRTGRLIWIFGDPTKYWYSFPSLRAKSLKLADGGLYPIGQHGISITPEGQLLLFNNGFPSFRQPPGAPSGESRTYSAVSAYTIDTTTATAREVWRFDYGKSVYSDICSNASRTADGSTLVNYAASANRTKARLVGLDKKLDVVFDFEYTTTLCGTSFNAQPLPFEALIFN
jgi:arylsulfate sulfotransferase